MGKSVETENRLGVAKEREKRELGDMELFFGVMEMFWKWIVVEVARNCEIAKTAQEAKEALLPSLGTRLTLAPTPRSLTLHGAPAANTQIP